MARNIKRKDFDYYLTNLDWDDGSDIERDVKQFTRNDVFEHTYERPGFYSIKGLVFKHNELLENFTPIAENDMSNQWVDHYRLLTGNQTVNHDWRFTFPLEASGSTNAVEIRSQASLENLKSDILEVEYTYPDNLDTQQIIIRESFNRDVPIFLATNECFPPIGDNSPFETRGKFGYDYGAFPGSSTDRYHNIYRNSILGMIEHRPRTQALMDSLASPYYDFYKFRGEKDTLPGINIGVPVKMSYSENDHMYFSMDLNLPNPNREYDKDHYLEADKYGYSNYAVRVRMHMPKADGSPDWGNHYDDTKYVRGIGKGSRNWDGRGENNGWQTVKHISFAQPKDNVDSEGNDISGLSFDVAYVKIEIYPTSLSSLPKISDEENHYGHFDKDEHIYHPRNIEFMALRNLSVKFPNTKGIIRPVEWQRFRSNMVVNPRVDYDSPLFEETEFAMIGGLSKNSSHFKTLTSLVSYDIIEEKFYDVNLSPTYNEYDVISMYDTFAKYDDRYYHSILEPYTRRIHEDYAPYGNHYVGDNNELTGSTYEFSLHNKPKITDGMIDRRNHGVFKDTSIMDVDIATAKVYTKPISMWEQLGFDSEELYGNPESTTYWNNIIPKGYGMPNRTGVTKRNLPNPNKGVLTPRINRQEYIVDEAVDQEWQDGYHWPIIPQLNKLGVFVSGSVNGDEQLFGSKTRWDSDDDAIITNISRDPDPDLKFNLNLSTDDIDDIQDINGSSVLRYVTDWTLHLDDNKRISKDVIDIFDTLENKIDEQAF